jgi:cell division transport system permease protein
MRALRYAFDEAVASLWRGRQSGLLSTATIAVALFVLGVVLLATSNLERLSREWSRTAELSVYLDDEATQEDRHGVERLLAPGALVASHEYVSKAEALSRFKQIFPDLATQSETLDDNPMPASYEVRLRGDAGAPALVDELAAKLRQSAGVADVRYDREWLDRLLSAVNLIRGAGLALGALLTLAAGLTVANVVQLALHARRDEVEIMQLVGAPTVYVRGPFVMEGVLQGGAGALIALVLLAALFLAVRGLLLTPLAGSVNLSSIGFLPVRLCVMLLVGGMAVGCLGGMIAARRT